MKRIVTVQDISCVGKCSLTVALPVISAMGVETAVIPTAVLSTHTAFENFTFCDLTAEIPGVLAHWKQQHLQFDGIYTGYLGSAEQLQCVSKLIADFKTPDTFVLIDPVMGDNGKLYAGFTPDFARKMAELCGKADVIVPNLTEATAMLGVPYTETYDEAYIRQLLRQLSACGARKTVLTGVSFDPTQVGVMAYDSETDSFFSYFRQRITQNFHGTGDVFASALTGAMTRGMPLAEALRLAVDFTVSAIHETVEDASANWYGVNFETALPLLIQRLKE